MKNIILLCFFLLLLSCKESEYKSPISKKEEGLEKRLRIIEKKYLVALNTDFLIELTQDKKGYNSLYIKGSKKDTVYKKEDFVGWFNVVDFDSDGYQDIVLDYMGNNPSQDLILFNPNDTVFKQVEDFYSYPDAKAIENSEVYYSYKGTGCADNYWISDLFTIKDFNTVHLGKIDGQGCEVDSAKNGIYIYKFTSGGKRLLDKLPIEETEKFKNGKLELIANYWRKNHKQFTN